MKRATIFRVVSIVLSVIVVSILVLFLFKNNVESIFKQITEADLKYSYEHTVTTNSLKDLEIEWKTGNVEIVPVKATKPVVAEGEEAPEFAIKILEKSSKKLEDKEQASIDKGTDSLEIKWAKKNLMGFLTNFNFYEKRLYIEVPDYILADMHNFSCHNVSGTIKLANVVSESIDLGTVSGNVELRNIKAQGIQLSAVSGDIALSESSGTEVSVTSTSGTIHVNAITVKQMNAENVSGEMVLEASADHITANTVSGAIKMKSLISPKQASFETVSGDITLALPKDIGFTANFDSVSGKLKNDFDSTKQDDDFVTGNGKSALDFSTISGDVRIKPLS